MRRGVSIILVTAAALGAAALAFGQADGRVALRGLEGNPTDHYSPTLAVTVLSPPEYERGCCHDSNGGEWVGPRYQATGRPSLGANATIDWSVGVAVGVRDARAALIANLTHDWPVVTEGQEDVEHRAGGRAAGGISGRWVLTRSTFGGADDAHMEAAIGFPLCDGNTVYAKFSLLAPSSNSAGGSIGFGEYQINGRRPTDWNAEKGMESIRGIRLEGNRPASRVTAAASSRRRVTGRVVDCDTHAVAAAAVQLQRRSGRAWRTVASGRTSATGAYTLRARSAGTHRVRSGARTSPSFRVR